MLSDGVGMLAVTLEAGVGQLLATNSGSGVGGGSSAALLAAASSGGGGGGAAAGAVAA